MDVPVKHIELPDGSRALVSAEDYDRVSAFKWCNDGSGYVHARLSKTRGGSGRIMRLHHFILGKPAPGMVIDHIDGDPLNNTRDNLQLITQSRNCMKAKRGAKGYQRHGQYFRVRRRVDGAMRDYGLFRTEAEAAARAAEVDHLIWEATRGEHGVAR